MPAFDHFDLLASRYERFIQPKDPAQMVRMLQLPTTGALLDAGGGTGRVSQFFAGMANPLVVADLSPNMLAEARQKNALSPLRSHSENLPFPDGSFARIIMVDALHHVIDQQQSLTELWRVLQPGGILVIEEPDIRTFTVKLLALAEKLALMRSHFLSPAQIANLFTAPNAAVHIEADGFNAWVIVEKLAN